MRPPAAPAARALVAERFPDADQAWLAGSTTAVPERLPPKSSS